MSPALFDTSIYISALRQGDDALLTSRRVAGDALLWLSAVVLQELYAGVDESSRPVVERFEHDFDRARRIVVPNLGDWTLTGKVLSRLTAKYDSERIGGGRLTNDALIAMSAARLGIRVVTANRRDFSRLAEFRSFQWEVVRV
jgi:predicted nucleic acid-binding protein